MEEIFEKLEASTSCTKLAYKSKEQKQSWNLLEFRSFNIYKNTAILIILDHSKINIEVSDTSMKTTKSNSYKEVLKDNRDINSILTIIWEKVRFFYKNRQHFINLFA